MASEQGLFDGRRGQKRLKLIEKQKEKIRGDFTTEYEDSREMHFLREELKWEVIADLLMLLAMRAVHFKWQGVRDYGFLRLCKNWAVENEIHIMTQKDTEVMLASVLPGSMCNELNEELSESMIF